MENLCFVCDNKLRFFDNQAHIQIFECDCCNSWYHAYDNTEDSEVRINDFGGINISKETYLYSQDGLIWISCDIHNENKMCSNIEANKIDSKESLIKLYNTMKRVSETIDFI